MNDDWPLLERFAREGAQDAFAALVGRHLNLVYSAARRQTASRELAEEVAQSVFLELARQASRLQPGQPLVAWLHVVTRRTAINAVRDETRRRVREQAAAELSAMNPNPSAWLQVEPLLDEAVAALPETDRSAILLRFFEQKSLRDIGTALGTTEDAAQKRVSRALEQLRPLLAKRGVAITAAGLATDLSAHAIETAPAALGATISAGSFLTPAAIGAAALEVTKTIAMTTLQKTTVAAIITLAVYYHFHQTSVLQSEIARLEERNARIATGFSRAQRQRAEAEKEAEGNRRALQLEREGQSGNKEGAGSIYLAGIDTLNGYLDRFPQMRIPELSLLQPVDWLKVTTDFTLGTDEEIRKAVAELRLSAKKRLGPKLTDQPG